MGRVAEAWCMRNLAEDRKEQEIAEWERQRAALMAMTYAAHNPEEASKLYTRYEAAIRQRREGAPVAKRESATSAVLRDPYLSRLVTRVVTQRQTAQRAALLAARQGAAHA